MHSTFSHPVSLLSATQFLSFLPRSIVSDFTVFPQVFRYSSETHTRVIILQQRMINRIVESYLHDLTDFSNIATSRHNISTDRDKDTYRDRQNHEDELDLANQTKLLEQFNNLREKLRAEQKKNNDSRKEAEKCQRRWQDKVGNLEIREVQSQAAMKYLKKEVETINEGIDKLKVRNLQLQKEAILKDRHLDDSKRLSQIIRELSVQSQELRVEKEKIKEIAILDKLQLENRITQLQNVCSVDQKHFQGVEKQLLQLRKANMALQIKCQGLEQDSHLRSVSKKQEHISVETKCNKLEKENVELEREKTQLKKLFEEEKAARKKNQSASYKKEELVALYHLQNEAQTKELNHLKRRVEKLTDRYEIKAVQAECEAFKNMETLAKLHKSMEIAEELIHRLKKDHNLAQDVQKLLKVSEYKISKIKETQAREIKASVRKFPSKCNLSLSKRARSKSPNSTTPKVKPVLQDPFSYTTPKLKEDPDLLQTAHPEKARILEERLRNEMREKENQMRNEIEFKKYSRTHLKITH